MSCLFIFRRDLRIQDNKGYNECCKKYDIVYPCFIMDPKQLKNNSYKSERCIYFMYESLKELNNDLDNKLNLFYGNPASVIKKLINKIKPKSVIVNMDYSPYSRKRDEKIKKACGKNVEFESYEDLLLLPIGKIKTGGKMYRKFTPYYDKAKKIKISKEETKRAKKIIKLSDSKNIEYLKKFTNKKGIFTGGRSEALKILRNKNNFKSYGSKRDNLMYETTHLSAHIKFGTVSIREVYNSLKGLEALTRQLYWRDFYTNLGYFYPEFTEKRVFQPKLKNWNNKYLKEWKEGKTGIPIVDATMRELNETGYCHNRGRLIASGFAKFLLLDWKECEKYYATQLIDYDIFANHFNWNWSFSLGPFSTPWFRIMNVFIQGKKHDKNGEYIKKWVPELKNVKAEDLHKWDKVYNKYDIKYPKPIIEYKEQRDKCYNFYKELYD